MSNVPSIDLLPPSMKTGTTIEVAIYDDGWMEVDLAGRTNWHMVGQATQSVVQVLSVDVDPTKVRVVYER